MSGHKAFKMYIQRKKILVLLQKDLNSIATKYIQFSLLNPLQLVYSVDSYVELEKILQMWVNHTNKLTETCH